MCTNSRTSPSMVLAMCLHSLAVLSVLLGVAKCSPGAPELHFDELEMSGKRPPAVDVSQLIASNPCLVHYCGRGQECVVDANQMAKCVCQRFCPRRQKTVCGSDGEVYQNHCEMHRMSCLKERKITLQHADFCRQVTTRAPSACSPQEYEIMKDNLLLYSHARLISSDNNHSRDFLVSIMFSHYDQNNNGHLETTELRELYQLEHLEDLSAGCVLSDMLVYDDTNRDGHLSINEFYQAFNKMYSVSVVSLDKVLETNHLTARLGDNVEIKCDVTGSPAPPIVWHRNGVDLLTLVEENIRVFTDGSLYLTHVQLVHAGNYTCHAQGNDDVVQTHILTVHTIPRVRVMPRIQSRGLGENAEMFCHVTGEPFPAVEWLKNDEAIRLETLNKYEVIGNGTALHVLNITYSDTGAFMCRARNIGSEVKDISSLIVQEDESPTVLIEENRFFVFHKYGAAIYEPGACRLVHQIQGTDIIPGTQDTVCGLSGVGCSWGRAINIGTRYIYVSQPYRDRVLIISTLQMVVVDVIATDRYPVELHYVPHLDQVWILNWRRPDTPYSKTLQVIRDAGEKKRHQATHPQMKSDTEVIRDFFVPTADFEPLNYAFNYGYVTHQNTMGLQKIDLNTFHYVRYIDLSSYACLPYSVTFSAYYGIVVIACIEPDTNTWRGQLILDYLTDSVMGTKPAIHGVARISPNSRHIVSTFVNNAGTTLTVQQITSSGLQFSFDVKTTLNISDATFYESQTTHGYDLFASASDKEDILYLNLDSGKVEMITGVGPGAPLLQQASPIAKWGNSMRSIKSSGLFGQYMVTLTNSALFVINGKSKTVNCEIGGVLNPVGVVWAKYRHNSLPPVPIARSREDINEN
ncbi:follistatin-related protein 5-like [Phlebotomus argentipes]|uniref:follistatin-related protein 5-like n=1 Tax=Phlebotomus argentipes TaxID=94469 RepID=UPI002892FD69|nr:follistatin-related protein 5-like [Phlebotomus argentipes]